MATQVDAVVFGAGGGVGFECIQHLLQKGQTVRAVVRNPSKYADKFPKNENLSVAAGGGRVSELAALRSSCFDNDALHATAYKTVTTQANPLADVTNVDALKSLLQNAKGAIFAASGTTFWSAASVDFQVEQSTATPWST